MSNTAVTDPAIQILDADHVLVAGSLVQRFRILGTTTWVHQAWAPVATLVGAPFTTLTHFDDGWWGKLSTERDLPPELDALPALSDERYAAVRAWQDARSEEAYALILRAFPETVGGYRSMGEICLRRD
jgi:hypothetical protein